MTPTEAAIRFVVGGAFVSAFAILSDALKPKSFAGLFGAAPSVALATLLLTIGKQGAGYAAIEAQWMLAGAVAFFTYAWCVAIALSKGISSARLISILFLLVWLAVAFATRLM